MGDVKRGEHRYMEALDWLWLVAWGLASSLWCLTAARHLGATFDEQVYLERGLEWWHTGSHKGLLLLGTMPLPADVQTLPLYLWERWNHIRFDPNVALAQPLVIARTATLIFWWLLLIHGRLIGRQLGGAWAGRIAVALLACEPDLLAHASLATTDIAVSACLLAFCYHFQQGRDQAWLQRIGWPALWFGALILTKASGVVFGTLCMLVIEYDRRQQGQQDTAENGPLTESLDLRAGIKRIVAFLRERALWKDIRHIVGWGMALVFLYCGCDWQPQPDLVKWAHHLPPGTESAVAIWSTEHLRLFSNAGEGILKQVGHNGSGHSWYLLGRSGERYIWYYFPVLLTIKLSLPLLLLPFLLWFARARCLRNWACLCALMQILLSVTYHVQIGIRFLFPAICLGIVGLSAGVCCAAKEQAMITGNSTRDKRSLQSRLRAWTPLMAAGIAILYGCVMAVKWWPNGLAYTNGLWGDSRKGYLLVSDSNYDWGQGLPELEQWRYTHPNVRLALWYFGHDPASQSFEEVKLHDMTIRNEANLRQLLRGRYLAVNTTLLYGGYVRPPLPLITCLRHLRPAAQTSTFLIYDFTEKGSGNIEE